ncbi:MAG: hypothetical protein JRD69_02400 [Deltaproteobacteria bacterium]|nr:hypothetical protein [Deltaproteobacteria bacterium]
MYRSVIHEKSSDRASEFLIAVQNRIPQVLVDDKSYDNLIKTASSVPFNIALSPFLLECSLDDSSRMADLSFGLLADRDYSDFQFSGFEEEHSALLKSISSLTGRSDNRLKSQLAMIWLEYDVGEKPASIPSLFLTPETGTPAQSTRILTQIQRDLGERYIDARYSKKAGDIIRRLPDKSSVRQIGIMASRGLAPLRLCLAGLDNLGWQKMGSFLGHIGYNPSCKNFFSLYKRLEPFVDICDLSLDVTERIEPRIGLELLIRQRNPRREKAWHHVLKELEMEGLCSHGKMDELLNFYGYDSIIENQERWPRSLAVYWEENRKQCCSFLIRSVNHLKISFDPAEGMSAKAYLKITHHWKNINGSL